MSFQLFEHDTLFLQRFLRSTGFYAAELDGIYGKKTDAALNAFEERSAEIAAAFGKFDARSEKNIGSLQPKAQQVARGFLKKVRDAGIDARIISGTRTYAEQDALYSQGRFGNPGPIVTKAEGGESNHNFGIAWDIGIFDGGAYLRKSPLYDKAAEVGLSADLEWGGNWIEFQDKPHYQLAVDLILATMRDKFEIGEAIV